ncbi:hypothetical protein NN561_001146 [Cricetulus griseus]
MRSKLLKKGEGPLARALTGAGDSITAPASSPRCPPSPSPAATQPTPLRSSRQPARWTVRRRVDRSARLARGRALEGGPYLPRRSRGPAWLRLLRLDYSPASRARLEYIQSSGGPGRRGGPLAAAERSAGPGHPAPLAPASGCGRWAERKPADRTRQPPGAAKGAGTCGGGRSLTSLGFLSSRMARGPVSLRHRPLTHWRGRGPLRVWPWKRVRPDGGGATLRSSC